MGNRSDNFNRANSGTLGTPSDAGVRAEHTMTLAGGGSSVASSKQVHKAFARVPRHNYYLAVLNTAGERRVYAFRFWNR